MAGGGGNTFPTEGAEERIKAAMKSKGELMRQIAGHPTPEDKDKRDG